jgi:hypothetical protein
MSAGVPAASKIAEVALVSVSAESVNMSPPILLERAAQGRPGDMRLRGDVGCQLLAFMQPM